MNAPTNNDWTTCPRGEFSRLAGRLRTVRRRRILVRAASTAVVMLVAFAVGMTAANFNDMCDYHYAGIGCSRVRKLAPLYAAGKLDAALTNQIHLHISMCPYCRKLFSEMKPPVAFGTGGRRLEPDYNAKRARFVDDSRRRDRRLVAFTAG